MLSLLLFFVCLFSSSFFFSLFLSRISPLLSWVCSILCITSVTHFPNVVAYLVTCATALSPLWSSYMWDALLLLQRIFTDLLVSFPGQERQEGKEGQERQEGERPDSRPVSFTSVYCRNNVLTHGLKTLQVDVLQCYVYNNNILSTSAMYNCGALVCTRICLIAVL